MKNRMGTLAITAWTLALPALCQVAGKAAPTGPPVHRIREGFVDANGLFLFYKEIGSGPPLVVVHGGPGASHDYFLPYLLPLARHHRVVFIDERGSGRSQKVEDPRLYTVE